MADQENPSAQKRERSEFIKRQRARFELSRRQVSSIFPHRKLLSDLSDGDKTLKCVQSTPRIPVVPPVCN